MAILMMMTMLVATCVAYKNKQTYLVVPDSMAVWSMMGIHLLMSISSHQQYGRDFIKFGVVHFIVLIIFFVVG